MSHQPQQNPAGPSVHDLHTNTKDPTALITRFRDQIAELADHFQSYRSLERFAMTDYADEQRHGVPNSRGQLSALLRAINEPICRQIEALAGVAVSMEQAIAKR
ncbi:hypothetical protein [Hydrogenophaga sp. BPS33]|uniref:hypothetical protein n=1 Tax=Hydrogenophaga sp. BPS33 TaxID=2651974 RepID=UPI00131FB5ED|nr:hypothetical protein [Hydrogenophaga sp. BPS33]QHE85462.1 hypothetical protein F9K07_11400 [Hydrogenophaga sp. BPS33]